MGFYREKSVEFCRLCTALFVFVVGECIEGGMRNGVLLLRKMGIFVCI